MSNTKTKNVCRVESKHFNGYRMSIMKKGIQFTAHFSAKKSGGWEAAEQLAISARDELRPQLEGLTPRQLLDLSNKYRASSSRNPN